MSMQETELKKKSVLRMSNAESKELTKECVRLALLHLLSNKSYEEISVTDIIRRSGVSRGGFYRNYSSKADVMDEMAQIFIENLSTVASREKYQKDKKEWVRNIFEEIQRHQDVYKLLFKANVPREYLFRIEQHVKERFYSDTGQSYYYIALNAALRAVLIEWFQNGMQESVNDMTDLMFSMMHISDA